MKLKHKKVINRLIVVVCLIISITILSLLKTSSYISEYVFSRGFSRAYIFLFSNITSGFRLSIFELALYGAIIIMIALIINWIKLLNKKRKSKFLKSFLNITITALIIVLVYTSTASFSYYRKELPLPQYSGSNLQETELEELLRYYLDDFRNVSDSIMRDERGRAELPYTDSQLSKLFIEEYNRIGTLNGYLSSYTPSYKNAISSGIMNYMQTSGIAITPTGEAHVNKNTPTNWKVITIAHELAHTKGVMREDDANLTAYYLALTSDNIYFRYAGYMYTIDRLYEMAYFSLDKETYRELYDMYPTEAWKERYQEYSFWQQYQTEWEKVSDFFNNLYLKLSGVKEGVDSYIDSSEQGILINQETGEQKYGIVEYSAVQKMYIELYLQTK